MKEAPEPALNKSRPDFASDYQSPAAMQLAKALRRKPRDIAKELARKITESGEELVEEPEISGPGFLGLRISEAALVRYAAATLADLRLNVPESDGSTILIDFSSPNVAKRMHIGHIRSTLIGEALRRMGSFLGYRVIGDNHIGDWGTQYGQLIHAWKLWLDRAAFDVDPVGELERLYVRFHEEAAGDDALNDAARAELAKLQAGDPDNLALWNLFRSSSQGAFDALYERLGVHFDHTFGESHYNAALAPLVARLEQQGIAEQSEGAKVIFFRDEAGEDLLPPFLIQKRDGAFLYATTDIATIEFRLARWDPARIIYVTDMRQQNHFKQLFAVARKLGIETALQHVWFGMMSLPEGAMGTRKGNVVRLDSLLDEAERRARANQVARNEQTGENWSDEDLDELARVIGLGAVKYADLSNNPQSNVTFRFDTMLSLEGNTAPYLQYTSARTWALSRKASEAGLPAPDGVTFAFPAEQDRDLALHCMSFGEALQLGFDGGKPSLLASFLYDLATKYHRWYSACPVLKAGSPELAMARLNLNLLVRRTLTQGLDLLGIEAPRRM